MISLIPPPLQIDSDCRQVSCHFDKNLLQEGTAGQFGLSMPPSLNGAVQKRKAEFIAGRYCAWAALSQLDCNFNVTKGDKTIGIGANREPLWPHGFVGSITHTHGYASAVVARRNTVRAVGLDSERWIEPERAEQVSRQILTTRESHIDHMQLFESPAHYLTLVFSAKESLFKCLFPLVNRFFDFHAAVIIPLRSGATAGGEFRFELLEDMDAEFRTGYSGQGYYSMEDDCVHTAVILKARGMATVTEPAPLSANCEKSPVCSNLYKNTLFE